MVCAANGCLRVKLKVDTGLQADVKQRSRLASLCLPYLLDRVVAVLRTYLADIAIRGRIAFPRCVRLFLFDRAI